MDHLIAQCDEISDGLEKRLSTILSRETASQNPFSVMTLQADLPPQQPEPFAPESIVIEDLFTLEPTLSLYPDWTTDEKFLFHHYVNHVSVIMLPYNHPRNTWKIHYPAAAIELASVGQNHLYNSMVAHAAFNVARLGGDFLGGITSLGVKHYGKAIQALIRAIGSEDVDFPSTMASIISLMFAEVRSSQLPRFRKTKLNSSITVQPGFGGGTLMEHGHYWRDIAARSPGDRLTLDLSPYKV